MTVAMLSCCVISSRSLPPVAVLSYKERLFTLSVDRTKPRVAQRPRRFERCNARAEKSELKVIVKPQSQWTVSLPLALASVEVVFLAAWIVSVRSLIPSLIFFQGAADVVLSGIMIANCVVGWYALERSRSEIDAPAAPGLMDLAFSLALSFIPLANLFMWLKFAFRQRDLRAKAKASLVANALIYEAPRLLGMMFLFSGGLAVLLGIGFASKLASLLSALHRPMAEARVRNESRIARSQQIISPEEQERIARLKELTEFDTLLARRSSYPGEPGTPNCQ